MSIWAIDAFQGFDWLHFLVKAETQEQAKDIVFKYFEWSTTDGIEAILKHRPEDYPEIVAFRADKGERDYGQQEFTIEDIGDIGVQDYNSSDWLSYDTVEEAQEYIDVMLKALGPGYCINCGGYDFNYSIVNIKESNEFRKRWNMKPLKVITTILEDVTPEKYKNKLRDRVVEWTRDYLNSFGGNTKAVIGISGGKDSTIAAKVCVEAVGADRVIGVLMPQGEQHDIAVSYAVCKELGIKSYEINIDGPCYKLAMQVGKAMGVNTDDFPVYYSNTPARVRMTVLYGVAAILGDARVVNTCNRSEDYVGYSTKFGDSAGDFSPLMSLTVREVKELGYQLGLPAEFIEKKPEDGLSGKTDEDNLGFTYDTLDDYLLHGTKPEPEVLDNIERRHRSNLHKLKPMPHFDVDK